jgi:hypothetical protein
VRGGGSVKAATGEEIFSPRTTVVIDPVERAGSRGTGSAGGGAGHVRGAGGGSKADRHRQQNELNSGHGQVHAPRSALNPEP